MKINSLLLFISGLLSVFYTSSCKKFLNEKPDKKLVVPKTVADLQALLDNNAVMNRTDAAFDEASTTDYYVPEINQPYLQNEYDYLGAAYTWQNNVLLNHPKNDWFNLYNVVGIANTTLDFVDGIERKSSNSLELDNIKGQALFFKARAYLKAAFLHAKAYDESTADQDLGIVLRSTTDFNVKSVRASVKDTYDSILSHLEQAAELLPVISKHQMRPSKPAAYALLARTWLSMRNYKKALYGDRKSVV